MNEKGWSIMGGVLIFIGWMLFASLYARQMWPLTVIGVGAVFLAAAVVNRLGALAIPGAILAGLGGLLFAQNLTGNWASWLVVWPLVPGLVGLGLALAQRLGMGGQRVGTVGWIWAGEGLGMCALLSLFQVLFPAWFSWPLILVGLGGMFLLATVLTGIAAQAIPAAVLGGLGIMMYWQALTGHWASWAYAWTLLPAFVGAGLLVAYVLGLGGTAVRRAALGLLGWSAAAFVVFAIFFAFGGLLFRYWPMLLVVAGLGLLLFALMTRSRKARFDVA